MRKLVLLLLFITTLEARNITVIGIGRTGLCLALCLEKAGFEVLGVDVSPEYVKRVNDKSFQSPEPGVNELLKSSKNFKATHLLDEGLNFSDLYFVVVPTNPVSTGSVYDCAMLDQLLSDVNKHRVSDKHLVIVSTICPSYIQNSVIPKLQDCPGMSVSYNPMFIAQGDIINGMHYPDMVLIGQSGREKGDEIETIQRKICKNQPYFARMSSSSAEIAKLALNCFFTMKISFANLIADIADASQDADKIAILKALGKDSRVGEKLLIPGYGFGGPCFPRDNRALGTYAKLLGIEPTIFQATDKANYQHAQRMASLLLEEKQEEYLFEDVCYKPKCPVPIIEESQKLAVAKLIADAGKKVIIKDRPEVIKVVQQQYGDAFKYVSN